MEIYNKSEREKKFAWQSKKYGKLLMDFWMKFILPESRDSFMKNNELKQFLSVNENIKSHKRILLRNRQQNRLKVQPKKMRRAKI